MSNKQLKWIKCIKDFPFSGSLQVGRKYTLEQIQAKFPVYFDPVLEFTEKEFWEYELEDTRYWLNGSLFDEPEIFTKGFFVIMDNKKKCFITCGAIYSGIYFDVFMQKQWFDDLVKARKYTEVLNDKKTIERRIQEINLKYTVSSLRWVSYRLEDGKINWYNDTQKKEIIGMNKISFEARNWLCETNEFTEEQKINFLEY